MQRMVIGAHAIDHLLRSLDSEVAVQLKHRCARRHKIRSVNLNFVVALTVARRAERRQQQQQREMFSAPHQTRHSLAGAIGWPSVHPNA